MKVKEIVTQINSLRKQQDTLRVEFNQKMADIDVSIQKLAHDAIGIAPLDCLTVEVIVDAIEKITKLREGDKSDAV